MKNKSPLIICLLYLLAASNLVLANNAFDCIVTPSKITDVTAAVSGRPADVLVDRSDSITAGQIIAELDAEVERASLAVAVARANMKSEIHLGKINYAFGVQRKERLESLNVRKVASNQDLDDATRDAALAAWNLQQAKDLHEMRKLERERAEAQLRQRTVTSPITGVVLERYKNKGEYVEDQAIVRIAQLDPLYVETIVPITRFGQIQPGNKGTVTLITNTGEPQTAIVKAVDRTGDAAAGTFGVRLELANPDGLVPAGVKCQVTLQSGTPTQATQGAPATRTATPIAAIQ